MRSRVTPIRAPIFSSVIAFERLGENRLCASELDKLRILVERDPHAPCLLCEGLQYCLSYPPHRITNELDALIRIELSHCFEETFVADRYQLSEIQAVALI